MVVTTSTKVAVGYVRRSDIRQGGGTIETQKGIIKKFIENEGFQFGEWYHDEESGLLDRRSDYQRMLRDARQGKFQAVVVARFDRFGRDTAEYFPRLKELDSIGIDVLSASEGNGSTLNRGIHVLMADEYSRELSRKIIPNKVNQGKQGYWSGKPIPGYRVSRLMPNGDLVPSSDATQVQRQTSLGAVLSPNEDAETVIEAFNLYAEGKASLVGIVDFMRERGIAISRSGVRSMLTNPAYVGILRFGRYSTGKLSPRSEEFEVRGKHTPIIDEETFERVQERLGINRTMKRAAVRSQHMLTGLLVCGLCGTTMTVISSVTKGHRYLYWRCRATMGDTIRDERCKGRAVSERKLNDVVKEKIIAALKPLGMDEVRDRAREMLVSDAAIRQSDADAKRHDLERRVAELDDRLTNAEYAFLDGLMGRERYIQRRDEITGMLEEAQRQLATMPRVKTANIEELFEVLDSLEWEALSDQGWRELIRVIVERITWTGEGVVIEWKEEYQGIL